MIRSSSFAIIRIAVAAAALASLSSTASAGECDHLKGWARGLARLYCVAQNHPEAYTRCSALAIERGYHNKAPGKGRFVFACMIARAGQASLIARHS